MESIWEISALVSGGTVTSVMSSAERAYEARAYGQKNRGQVRDKPLHPPRRSLYRPRASRPLGRLQRPLFFALLPAHCPPFAEACSPRSFRSSRAIRGSELLSFHSVPLAFLPSALVSWSFLFACHILCALDRPSTPLLVSFCCSKLSRRSTTGSQISSRPALDPEACFAVACIPLCPLRPTMPSPFAAPCIGGPERSRLRR